ncbi:hypothetical protein QF037_008141 [Streptomyces canus]|uniref:hypothetical protein n=1 Tax=Streptomyces canus TaxID=58343 RepID=UPI0027881761|nr:hypothetical protein [Streptomyces canus]MDQ0603796.1 hypothetical protein [Streptomyces canus]
MQMAGEGGEQCAQPGVRGAVEAVDLLARELVTDPVTVDVAESELGAELEELLTSSPA